MALEGGVSRVVLDFERRLDAWRHDPERLLEEAIAFADLCVASRFAGLSSADVEAIDSTLRRQCGAALPEVSPETEIVPRWLASMFAFCDANAGGNEVAFWLSVGDKLTSEYHRAVVRCWLPFLRDQAAESSRKARQVITCLQFVESNDARWFLNDIRLGHADPTVREYADYAMRHRWLRLAPTRPSGE